MSEDILTPALFQGLKIPDPVATPQGYLAELPRLEKRPYRQCTRCLMDTSDSEIEFDAEGICNHCKRYFVRAATELRHGPEGKAELEGMIARIKAEGKNKPYDCIIGVSGGVDSTMVAYQCKKHGLRTLAVHLDNGWDSELAVSNIAKTLKNLGIDLYTHVMDWEEFRDIQLSFLKASVANAEIPSDHAIGALLYQIAAKKGIRFVISGSNIETEAIMPMSWMYDNRDFKHLKAIHRQYGTAKLRTFPFYTPLRFFYYILIKRVRLVRILNYSPYNKAEALRILKDELGWVYYGGKHYESVFTRWFQGYYLPRKFGIDKRLAHLSTLICAGQITREEALKELESDPYPPELFKKDQEFVIKKFGLSQQDFEDLMKAPPRKHTEFPCNQFIFQQNRFGLKEIAKRIASKV